MKASDSRKIDRILVLVAALLGLGLSAMVIVKAMGFKDGFRAPLAQSQARGKELLQQATADVEATKKSIEAVRTPNTAEVWKPVTAVGKDRGFLVSTSLVFRRGATDQADTILDLDKPEPRLRDNLPNEYLLKYRLQFEHPNVVDLDQDEDFFTNLEEFQFGQKLGKEFDPTNKESRPPLHYRLTYAKYDEEPYEFSFKSGTAPDFFLGHADKANPGNRWSALANMGEDLNGNGKLDEGEDRDANGQLDGPKPFPERAGPDQRRFIIRGFKQVEKEKDGIVQKLGVLTVEDSTRPDVDPLKRFEVTEGETVNLPTKKAVFDYAPKPGAPIEKREFDKFTLPDTLAPSYLLKEITQQQAVLEFEEGGKKATVTIPMGKMAEPTPP